MKIESVRMKVGQGSASQQGSVSERLWSRLSWSKCNPNASTAARDAASCVIRLFSMDVDIPAAPRLPALPAERGPHWDALCARGRVLHTDGRLWPRASALWMAMRGALSRDKPGSQPHTVGAKRARLPGHGSSLRPSASCQQVDKPAEPAAPAHIPVKPRSCLRAGMTAS